MPQKIYIKIYRVEDILKIKKILFRKFMLTCNSWYHSEDGTPWQPWVWPSAYLWMKCKFPKLDKWMTFKWRKNFLSTKVTTFNLFFRLCSSVIFIAVILPLDSILLFQFCLKIYYEKFKKGFGQAIYLQKNFQQKLKKKFLENLFLF